MAEDRNPLEVALDLFVFAPFGVFLSVTEELPKLVEKGRTRLEGQVNMARMMGQFAAPQIQQEAEKKIKEVLDRLTPPGPPPAAVRSPAAEAGRPAPPAPPSDRGPSPAPPSSDAARPAAAPVRPSGPEAAGSRGGPGSGELAIPAYDSLSAMQVVQRLSGLSTPELEAVRGYEEMNRARKTILNRADQLLSEAG